MIRGIAPQPPVPPTPPTPGKMQQPPRTQLTQKLPKRATQEYHLVMTIPIDITLDKKTYSIRVLLKIEIGSMS